MSEVTPPSDPLVREARHLVAAALRRAIADQEAGRVQELADTYDDVYAETLPLTNDSDPLTSRALYFWDSWGDAARHEWHYYEGIARADWPRMASALIMALEAGGRVEDSLFVEKFEKPRPSFWQRLGRVLGVTDANTPPDAAT